MTKMYYTAMHYGLLVWPAALSCDRSGGSIPLVESIFDARNVAFVVLVACALSLAVSGLWRKNTLTLVALSTSIVPFIPASGLLVNVGFTVAERVLYIPSIGICFVGAHLFTWMHRKGKRLGACVSAAALLFCASAMTFKTWSQNKVWDDEQSLYRAALEAYPNNAKAHFNYGTSLDAVAEYENVRYHYEEAIRLHPLYTAPYNNLGVLLANRNDLAGAIDVWGRGLEVQKQNPIVTKDAGMLQRNIAKAEASLKDRESEPA